ncbi:hypothetical protein Bbelb_254280 [Branchiostoma belcheri]|nr:hypothetical protein Bbelb_254280 [Branchiostoma belcheri]
MESGPDRKKKRRCSVCRLPVKGHQGPYGRGKCAVERPVGSSDEDFLGRQRSSANVQEKIRGLRWHSKVPELVRGAWSYSLSEYTEEEQGEYTKCRKDQPDIRDLRESRRLVKEVEKAFDDLLHPVTSQERRISDKRLDDHDFQLQHRHKLSSRPTRRSQVSRENQSSAGVAGGRKRSAARVGGRKKEKGERSRRNYDSDTSLYDYRSRSTRRRRAVREVHAWDGMEYGSLTWGNRGAFDPIRERHYRTQARVAWGNAGNASRAGLVKEARVSASRPRYCGEFQFGSCSLPSGHWSTRWNAPLLHFVRLKHHTRVKSASTNHGHFGARQTEQITASVTPPTSPRDPAPHVAAHKAIRLHEENVDFPQARFGTRAECPRPCPGMVWDKAVACPELCST